MPEPTLSDELFPIPMAAASEAEAKLNHERGKVLSEAARQRKAVIEWERGGNETIGGLERGRIEVGFIGNIPYKYYGSIIRERAERIWSGAKSKSCGQFSRAV